MPQKEQKTLTGTLNAYLHTKYCKVRPQDLHGVKDATQEQIDSLLSAATFSMYDYCQGTHAGDYVSIGTVQVTLTLLPQKEVVDKQVAALRQQKKQVQAEATREITEIDGRINSLLALPAE